MLYDDLDVQDSDGWAASGDNKKHAKSSQQDTSTKTTNFQPQPRKPSSSNSSSNRQTASLGKHSSKKHTATSHPVRFNQLTGKLEVDDRPDASSDRNDESLMGSRWEYDPKNPNDFDDMKRRIINRPQDVPIWLQPPQSIAKSKDSGGSGSDSDNDGGAAAAALAQTRKKAAIAPPKSLLQQDLAPPKEDAAGNASQAPSVAGGGASAVSRMMAKMGYKEGQGLGKLEQGMSTALQVAKTSLRGGKIIHEKDMPPPAPGPVVINDIPRDPTVTPQVTSELLRNPSKVVVLRNMVGAGEVDNELEGETIEECSKYGKVSRCVIYELPATMLPTGGSVPPPADEAVRIFVDFETVASAIKAVVDLNGRFFGGKVVRANFYNLERFRNLKLGDELT